MGKLKKLLTSYSGKKVIYCPNPGNGGDALIAEATFRLFDRYGIKYSIYDWNTNNLKKSDHFFFGGGGNLVTRYPEASTIPAAVHDRVEKFIILPHTIEGHDDLFSNLKDNSIVFAREKKSFEYLKNFQNIGSIELDHDLAFSLLEDKKFIKKCKVYSIICIPFYVNILRRKRKAFSLNQRSSIGHLFSFREDREKTHGFVPWDNFDISKYTNFDSSMRVKSAVTKTATRIPAMINLFSIIETNRIHIAISGLLMGKSVKLHPNNYWKNNAIYEFSIKNRFNNIRFIHCENNNLSPML